LLEGAVQFATANPGQQRVVVTAVAELSTILLISVSCKLRAQMP